MSERITDEKLDELITIAEKATPGPWALWDGCSWWRFVSESSDRTVIEPTKCWHDGQPDLHFNNDADKPFVVAAGTYFLNLLLALKAARADIALIAVAVGAPSKATEQILDSLSEHSSALDAARSELAEKDAYIKGRWDHYRLYIDDVNRFVDVAEQAGMADAHQSPTLMVQNWLRDALAARKPSLPADVADVLERIREIEREQIEIANTVENWVFSSQWTRNLHECAEVLLRRAAPLLASQQAKLEAAEKRVRELEGQQ